ncbi:MAG: hypothetical protein HY848_10830 [Betaproteobacteria bacterium]|nr:hypothetical protein [Betaproteobacteria bacterium]
MSSLKHSAMKHGRHYPNLKTSGDLNFSNRQARARMPGGTGGGAAR